MSRFTATEIRDYLIAKGLVDPRTLDPIDAMGIYLEAKANFVTGGELDVALGWPLGTADQWVAMNSLEPLAIIDTSESGGGVVVIPGQPAIPPDSALYQELLQDMQRTGSYANSRENLMRKYGIGGALIDRVYSQHVYTTGANPTVITPSHPMSPVTPVVPVAVTPITPNPTPIPVRPPVTVPVGGGSGNNPPTNVVPVTPTVTHPSPIPTSPFPTVGVEPAPPPQSMSTGLKIALAAGAALLFMKGGF